MILQGFFPDFLKRWLCPVDVSADLEMQARSEGRPMIEDYRPGYPQLSAFISSADGFFVFRRFKRLRARLLLLKQDKITVLEQKLDQLDRDESNDLFLCVNRCDANPQRNSLLIELEQSLASYGSLEASVTNVGPSLDQFADAASTALGRRDAEPRDVTSLRNWHQANGALARDEEAYLQHDRDLFALVPIADNALAQIEDWVERTLAGVSGFRDLKMHDISTDRSIIIYSGTLIKRAAKALLTILITILLLLPMVVCNVVISTPLRLFIVMVSTVLYLLVLSHMSRAKTPELVVAATTYATVLIVFVSGSHP